MGLYYDLIGRPEDARKHLKTAVKHHITHFMHDIARLHLEILKKEANAAADDNSKAGSPKAESEKQRGTRE